VDRPLVETHNHDLPDLGGRELYPSQTWATLNTGVPFSQHGIYWYGDPKPAEYPMYWQQAARAGRRVGIVGTVHSSPLSRQANDPNIAFAIPDCFATDPETRPADYQGFQRVSLALTRDSGRVSSAKLRKRPADVGVDATPRCAAAPLASLATLAAQSRPGASRERLRVAPFLLQRDMFVHLLRAHDPDLGVLFTNHVAAAMHRYWYAAFPEDYDRALYDEAWVARYRGEIGNAMRLLDHALGDLMARCDATGRSLVFTTGMGQRTRASAPPDFFAVVRRPTTSCAAGHTGAVDRALMVRRSASSCATLAAIAAETFLAAPASAVSTSSSTGRQRGDDHYRIDPGGGAITVASGVCPSWRWHRGRAVDDQRCTEHDPVGSVLQYGSTCSTAPRRSARPISARRSCRRSVTENADEPDDARVSAARRPPRLTAGL
jgi:hypothetical protein